MSFESLANELVICIFDYLDFYSICNGFKLINQRYHDLVKDYPKYYLNFHRISKSNLRNLIENHLPQINNHQIFSLELHDDDETPNIQSLVNFDRFIYLKSLKVVGVSTWPNIISKFVHLENLEIYRCHSELDESEQIEEIWKLCKLKSIRIDVSLRDGHCFENLKTTSSSIEKVCLQNFYLNLDELSNLLLKTPLLKFLNIELIRPIRKESFPLSHNNLVSLNFSILGALKAAETLFETLSNLRSLTIVLANQIHFGQQFEELIRTYLPVLRSFKMKLSFEYRIFNEDQTLIDRLLDSYRTSFWTIEHQWFFRCDWDPRSTQTLFYTIPYPFEDFEILNCCHTQSTEILSNKSIFQNVHHVRSTNNSDKFCLHECFEFPSIKTLEIVLPCSEELLNRFHDMHQLQTIDFTTIDDSPCTTQLQTLLDTATNLYQLKFSHISNFEPTLFDLQNPSIQRLDFSEKESMIFSWYFDETLCTQLVKSTIGQQCQVLMIDLKYFNLAFFLIENMSNLRSLTFHAADDKSHHSGSVGNTDALLDLLRYKLPTSYSIQRDKDSSKFIHIWKDT